VFCKFTSPLEQGYRETYTDVDVPVFMQGSLTIYVQVNPGDWIFGDCDGIVVVPKDMAEEVLIEAEEIVKRENIARAKMREGMDPQKVREQYKVG
ncbi:MAG: dimethylmenaquinone methyltransferase, partial [Candidatus Latescibacteria bacterium]|nr:dimethylmenaquinone methyltransferase [Candidatus Latescibacterota bacterium]